MPQVSKNQLDPKTKSQIDNDFYQTLIDLRSRGEARDFLEGLLTPTEKIMLSKRLGIAILLARGLPYRAIMDILKVSNATIGRVSTWLKTSGREFGRSIKN